MQSFAELLETWQRSAHADLIADDFRGDGADGVLDRQAWVEAEPRRWQLCEAHVTAEIAIAVGMVDDRVCTLVGVERDGRWQVVNVQIGQVVDVPTPSPGDAPVMQMPTPDPALSRLDRFVGTWDMHGRTVGAEADNVHGRTTFEWLPGGFFLQQRIKLDFAGMAVEGVEIIGYDPATGAYPSTVYPNMAPMPIPYRWELDGDNLTITTDVLGAVFHGRWSDDGKTFAGGWRAMPGREGPGNVAYDISGGRAEGV
jgi:hypothetical protein